MEHRRANAAESMAVRNRTTIMEQKTWSHQEYRNMATDDRQSTRPAVTSGARLRDLMWFMVLYTLLWLLLSGGSGLLFGAAFIALAAFISVALGFSLHILRPQYLPGLVLFYVRELLVAGWQVAYMACHPRLSLKPGWVTLKLRSNREATQLMLSTIVCLLPGTLTSRVDKGTMHIHLLDSRQPWRPTVEALEEHLMALLGEKAK